MRRGDRPIPFRRRIPTLTRQQDYANLARKLADERTLAETLTDNLLQTTERWPDLVEHPSLRTIGALVHLGKVFAETLPRNPQRAYALAQLGVSLSENLPADTYPPPALAQAKAYAWRDLGTALRILGRHQDSIDALLAAEAALTPFLALLHDIALMRFSLAITYQEVDRFAESRQLLIESKEVFRAHADTHRYTLCVFAEGVLLQRLQNYREARELYLLLLASPEPIPDDTLAAIHRTVGLCSIELSDFHEAEVHLVRSIQLNDKLDQRIEALKGQAALGRLYIRRGNAALAVNHLRPVRREFLRDGLTEEAGICGLEIVQGLLILTDSAQAETLARTIFLEFSTAGLSKRAIEALAHLTEAITARKASATLVTHVRDYIVSLRTDPERDFTASL